MIDKLELLIALSRERHFSRAAESVGVTQPTLSSAVKSLEEQFGVVIVERGSRFHGFTPEGEKLLDWARRIVGDYRAMREDMDQLKKGLTGRLRLGVIPTALPYVPELTMPFRARHGAVKLSVAAMTSDEIQSRVDNLELEAGISYIDTEPLRKFHTLPLFTERYALLVAPASPLAKLESITWAEAGRLQLCLLTPEMQNRRLVDNHLAEAGGSREPTLEANSMALLQAHVWTGEWATIMPARFTEFLDRPGRLKAITLTEPSVTHEIGLLIKAREPYTPVAAAFLAVAKRVAEAGKVAAPV